MCRADVPRVPEQFPEAGETLEDRLGHASPRIARPAVKTRAGVPFVDTLGVTNRVPPPIDARVCRTSTLRPRNGGRDLSGRREVSSSPLWLTNKAKLTHVSWVPRPHFHGGL